MEPIHERDYNIRKIVIGYYINLPEDVQPFYTVGVRCEKNFERCVELLREGIYARFKKSAQYEFLNLAGESNGCKFLDWTDETADYKELCYFIEQQGEIILDR